MTAHQSAYLPWLGYFHKIALSDAFLLLDDVQFEKNSFTNRNRVKGPNGAFWLTVPVNLKNHFQKKIKDIRISGESWRKKHLQSIEQNYKKSRYFKEYIPFFRDCYSRSWDRIDQLNEYILLWLFDQLKIKTKIFRMSEYDFKSKKSDLLIEMCRQFDVTTYVFGSLGKQYAQVNEFYKQGIKVIFQDYQHPIYTQLYNSFISNLSVVDLLFNEGPDSMRIILSGNMKKGELEK